MSKTKIPYPQKIVANSWFEPPTFGLQTFRTNQIRYIGLGQYFNILIFTLLLGCFYRKGAALRELIYIIEYQ